MNNLIPISSHTKIYKVHSVDVKLTSLKEKLKSQKTSTDLIQVIDGKLTINSNSFFAQLVKW